MRRLRALLPAVAALLAITAVASAGSREAELGRMSAEGPVTLGSSKTGRAVLQGESIKPGDSVTGLITLSNEGDEPGTLALSIDGVHDDPGIYGGSLSSVLRVRLEDLTSGSQPVETTLTRSAPIALADLPGRQTRTYRVIAHFPDTGRPAGPTLGDNLQQGASVEVGLAWNLTAKDTAVPAPPQPAPAGVPPAVRPVPLPTPGRPALVYLRVPAQRVIAPRKLSVFAECEVKCKVRFSAKIDSAPKAKSGKKAKQRRTLMAKRVVKGERRWVTISRVGKEKRVYLKLTTRALTRLKRQLHVKGRAGITVTATMRSAAGNRTVRRRIVMRTYRRGFRGAPAGLR